jgi:hypothetical protein
MNKTDRCKRVFLRFLLPAALLTAAAGCTNLSAVRDFARLSARSAEASVLVGRYAEFPERQKRFVPEAMHAGLNQESLRRAAQTERILLRHALVEEYMDALGRLSADDLVTYDHEIDALGKAASSGKFIAESDAGAFTAVAKLVFKAAADGWRRRQLRELIAEANAPLLEVIGALRQIVEHGFAGDAENETVAIQKYYQTLIRSSQDKAGIAAVEEWRDARLAEVGERRRTIADYAQALGQIAAGHQMLYERRDDLGGEETLLRINRHTRSLRRFLDSLNYKIGN